MKKQLTVALGLAVLATPAFASKARLLALGEDVNGSFYINDNRNIFLNASEVNSHKDLVTYEWGAADAAGAAGTPNSEGGLYRSVNNMVYGVQFGRNISFNTAETAIGTANTAAATNALDLFVGGDAGMKWGAQLTYSDRTSDVAPKAETSVIDLAAGVTQGDISGFVKYGVSGEAKATGDKLKRDQDLVLGASYKWGHYTAFGQYNTSKFEEGTNDLENNGYQVGIGRGHKLNDKATLFTKLSYLNSKIEETGSADDKETDLPLVVGLEYDAASWLTLRGSVSQSLYSKVDDGTVDGTKAETTTVAAGVTQGDISGFVKYGVSGEAKATGDKLKRDQDLVLGASYKWGHYTAFGQYNTSKFEEGTNDLENNGYQVGIGRGHKLNDKATLFTKVSYLNSKIEQTSVADNKETNLPLVVGLEYDAASWLTLRGSVSQSIYSKVDNGTVDGTKAETTTVAAGASLKFGELTVDGMIGNNSAANAAPTGDTTASGAGQLRTDSLMSRVSMTYRF